MSKYDHQLEIDFEAPYTTEIKTWRFDNLSPNMTLTEIIDMLRAMQLHFTGTEADYQHRFGRLQKYATLWQAARRETDQHCGPCNPS